MTIFWPTPGNVSWSIWCLVAVVLLLLCSTDCGVLARTIFRARSTLWDWDGLMELYMKWKLFGAIMSKKWMGNGLKFSIMECASFPELEKQFLHPNIRIQSFPHSTTLILAFNVNPQSISLLYCPNILFRLRPQSQHRTPTNRTCPYPILFCFDEGISFEGSCGRLCTGFLLGFFKV